VSDITHAANITLIGECLTGQFTIRQRQSGCTLVGDPPVVAQTKPQLGTPGNPH
jgi:hypothetical protein